MKLKKIPELIECRFVNQSTKYSETEVRNILLTNLMSQVLFSEEEELLLVTSLASEQVLRTADIVGVQAVILTDNKPVIPSMLELAKEFDICLFSTKLSGAQVKEKLGSL